MSKKEVVPSYVNSPSSPDMAQDSKSKSYLSKPYTLKVIFTAENFLSVSIIELALVMLSVFS